jgi:parallel beta-helix repeat protein
MGKTWVGSAAAALASIAMLLGGAAHADAKVRLHDFSGAIRGSSVSFRIKGMRRADIRWGRLRVNGRSFALSTRRLRLAARRGDLRTRIRNVRGPRPLSRHRAMLIIATSVRTPVAYAASTRHRQRSDGGPVGVALPVVPASAVYVSPSGSDSNPGTRDLPWRTLAKATSAAQPGQTVVLEPGTYGARGTRTNWTASGTATAPVVFIGDPTAGQRPTILGYNVLYGSHVQVWNMLFDGPTGSVDAPTSADPTGEDVMLWLTAPGIEIADSEIRNSLWHAGIYLTNADGDKLIGNYIHDNGNPNDPSQANLDHGIYWDDGNGGLIADNLITHNVAMGIQLYPSASNVTVDWNTIADNGKSGLIIAENSANNTIAHNIVANNSDNSIRSWSLTGTGNLVTNNIVWNNGNGNLGTQTDGLTLTANTQTNPDFLTGTYTPAAQSPATGQAGADESGLTSF